MRTRKLTFSKERLNGPVNEKFCAVFKVFSRKFQIFRKKIPETSKRSLGVFGYSVNKSSAVNKVWTTPAWEFCLRPEALTRVR